MKTARSIGEIPPGAVARFWSKVDRSGDCWVWTGGKTKPGYGRFYITRAPSLAHRVAYTISYGPIPDGMLVDHICHNKACVRPDHIRLATSKQNMENHAGPRDSGTSGLRNVHWSEWHQQWAVRVRSGSERHWGGYFKDKEAAGVAAKALRNRLYTHNDLDRK